MTNKKEKYTTICCVLPILPKYTSNVKLDVKLGLSEKPSYYTKTAILPTQNITF